jgi:hypothetical protein
MLRAVGDGETARIVTEGVHDTPKEVAIQSQRRKECLCVLFKVAMGVRLRELTTVLGDTAKSRVVMRGELKPSKSELTTGKT